MCKPTGPAALKANGTNGARHATNGTAPDQADLLRTPFNNDRRPCTEEAFCRRLACALIIIPGATTTRSQRQQQQRTSARATVPKTLLCVVAAAFHLHVFGNALRCLYTGSSSASSFATLATITRLERAVFLAYAWDLLCLAAGVVPFSRARGARDILSHHVPVFVFLAIGTPLAFRLRTIEPAVDLAEGSAATARVLARINGWGFVSSLNEAIMSAQQAETLWNALRSSARRRLASLETKKNGRAALEESGDVCVFNAAPVQLAELAFKLTVFTAFPVLSTRACLEYDVVAWRWARSSGGLLGAVLRFLGSLVIVRTFAWRAFILTQYPSMAQRTFAKIGRFVAKQKKRAD